MMDRFLRLGVIGLLAIAGCATWNVPEEQIGIASWYGPGFHGKPTASGEIYDMHAMTAAHRMLPFGSTVLVTRTDTGASTVVRINDRGPFMKGRIIDLSNAAARDLDMVRDGLARVRIDVIRLGGLLSL